jgi:hypothetical protein
MTYTVNGKQGIIIVFISGNCSGAIFCFALPDAR